MRKCLFVVSFFLCALAVKAQDSWVIGYISKNMEIDIHSNAEYNFVSGWNKDDSYISCIPDEDYNFHKDPNIIIWSEGKIRYVKDTLICVDSKTHKRIYLLKTKDGDVLKVIKWDDYKNRNEKSNWHLGWNNDPGQKVFIDNLFRESPYFYIINKRILDKDSGKWKMFINGKTA